MHPVGLAVGTLFAVLAMTPSLVPRDWLFQGVASGLSAAAGYGIGVAAAWLVRRSQRWRRLEERVRRRLPPGAGRVGWAVLAGAALALAVGGLVASARWQRQVAALMDVDQTTTGWVNEAASDSVELLHGGDTALVATQYSYLPSWLLFVVDRSRAEEAGRLVFDAVSARVQELPEDQRPRVLVYGESLGSHGSEFAFSSLADLRAQADGVLWVGPPNANRVWSALVQRRDPGSREVQPVYASGLVVRFDGDGDDVAAQPPTPWLEPRVLYLQHPSDPIVWWSPELLLTRPDWLAEPRGSDVPPAMAWYPVVTFWQVSTDLAHAQDVPDGHGHRYDDAILDGWVAVAAPPGWGEDDTARVRQVLTASGVL
ncbi:alpha/beta-hydrolase family protein [Quadrisphaera sp. DSM 44207]|uniref:alpha/beta-hydrolase family protein n=1 Tax=Quadrisphaera sp. DSM 44207 TaxID=1881057 RepID=UPI001C4092BE|nr:alpha/beta-hydrolase family protein [Quadrisphaera sp. DSM 44207]